MVSSPHHLFPIIPHPSNAQLSQRQIYLPRRSTPILIQIHLSLLGRHHLLVLDLALAGLLGANISEAHTTLSLGVQVVVRNLGLEAAGLPRLLDGAVQLIDLFKGEALCFVDHEPHESDANEAEGAPDEEDLGLQVGALLVDHVGGGVSNGPVEQPVLAIRSV
jgi:hypothetical protein